MNVLLSPHSNNYFWIWDTWKYLHLQLGNTIMWGKYFNRRVICIWLQHYHPLTPLVKEVVDNHNIAPLHYVSSDFYIFHKVYCKFSSWQLRRKTWLPVFANSAKNLQFRCRPEKNCEFLHVSQAGRVDHYAKLLREVWEKVLLMEPGIFYTDTNMFEPQITRLSSSTAMTQSGNYLSKSLIFVNISYNQQNPFCLICNPVLA